MKFSIFFLLIFITASLGRAQQGNENIRINQLGYYTTAPKLAVYAGKQPAEMFSVISISGDTVFSGKLSSQKKSAYSQTVTQLADFSRVAKPGTYRLYVRGAGDSYQFKIGHSVHHELAKATIRAFYYHRVSEELPEQFAGKWARPVGHPDDKVLVHASAASDARPAGTVIPSPWGWYDAGDYNKYIVNSGITMSTLMSAYEDFNTYFDTLRLNIPESEDGVPDLLNEVLYNLRWMMTMQDPNDGGVYHKCTNAAFDGMVMPGVTKLPRYVVQKGTAATLDFAAVMAQASRIFRRFEREYPGLGDSCLRAAQTAWSWAQKNPTVLYDQDGNNRQFEPKITTGAYGDRNFKDEWFWAASELLLSSGDANGYKQVILEGISDSISIPSWNSVRMLGIYSLLRHKNKLGTDLKKGVTETQKRMVAYADNMISKVQQSAFNTIMGQHVRDFIWGSNSVAANQSILLMNVYYQTGNIKYLQHALSNLDYILGRNATGYSFVTGFGTKSTMNPHHRPSVADGIVEPVPGWLAGGPNPGMQDKCKYEYTEPETAYVDHDCSYASNEVAINWQAPMVYLAAGMEALKRPAGFVK